MNFEIELEKLFPKSLKKSADKEKNSSKKELDKKMLEQYKKLFNVMEQIKKDGANKENLMSFDGLLNSFKMGNKKKSGIRSLLGL